MAVGSSGTDYDLLAAPVPGSPGETRLFFAGKHLLNWSLVTPIIDKETVQSRQRDARRSLSKRSLSNTLHVCLWIELLFWENTKT